METDRRGRRAGGALAVALAAGVAFGALIVTGMGSARHDPLPATPAVGDRASISTPPPDSPGTASALVASGADPVAPSRAPHPVTRPPSAATLPALCHFTGTDSGGVQVRPETKSGEDLVVFLGATDLHPCRAVVHYTFSVLDPSVPDGAPLLTASGTLDRALASSQLSIPVSSALAVAWTNWCGAPGTYTVRVTTDANLYYPEASTDADAPGCADGSRKPTFAVIDWLNQLDALSATIDGIDVGETLPVQLSSPTGVYAMGIDGVLFLGDPGLLGCTPTCDASLTASLSLLTPTHARLEGHKFAVDLVAAGPVPADARAAAF